MDFHELPRRDLQALCKRNGIRANMTNTAMADALAALPAVDGIEEEEKKNAAAVQAVAAEEEEEGEGGMQGIQLPGVPGVALTPHEVIILDDSEEEDTDLTPALGVGRRRATRRARAEPVSDPATRKRAAAAEAVPARTTRARSQRMVVSAPEEEAPKAIRTPRRALARKTSTEQEEEEKGRQANFSDDCVVDSSVEERQADVQQFQGSPVFRNDTVSSEEIHHTEIVPIASGEAAKEVDFTCGAAEENEVPTSGGMLQSAAKAIEEKELVATPATTRRKRAAASMTETAVEAVPARITRARSQRVVVSAPEEEAPKARRMSRRAVARKTSAEDTEIVPIISGEVAEEVDFTCGAVEENEMPTSGGMLQSTSKAIEEEEPVATPAMTTRKRAAASMTKSAMEATPAQTTRTQSQRLVVSAPEEEEAPKARRTPRRAVARKTRTGQEEEDKGTRGDVDDDFLVDSSVEEQQVDVQKCEDSPIFQNDNVSSEEIHHASEDTEMVPVNKVPLAKLKSGEAEEELDFPSVANVENKILPISCAKAIEQKEDLAADELTNNTGVFVEEEEAVATDEMPQRSATGDEGIIEVVTVDSLSQATVTDDEGVVKESGFTADLTHVSIEEHAALAADEKPLSLDESVKEEEVPVENLSQATLTDDEGALKGSGFSCDLADVSVEEDDGVFSAEEMSQRSAALDESVKGEVATVENLSQATVTDDEWAVKENAFAVNLPLVVVTARGFNDHSASRLSAGMRETATKSMSINSITEPVAVEREKEGKECEALGSLSLRKLRTKLKEKLAVAPKKNEADHVSVCRYSSSGDEKKASETVAVEREEEMKEGTESEALGSLSLRKLRIQLKEKVAVPEENEVKEGKEPKALDMLSLRKLKMKLKETLNAHKENR